MAVKRSTNATTTKALSDSTEDHLERIADFVERKGYARVTDVAEELGLTPSTVSNMVRRLAARGLLSYERYRGFNLTPEGRAVATRIKQRHQALTELLGLLGLEDSTVVDEVEDIEHHLRPQTLAVLEKLVGFWKSIPINCSFSGNIRAASNQARSQADRAAIRRSAAKRPKNNSREKTPSVISRCYCRRACRNLFRGKIENVSHCLRCEPEPQGG